jgi:NAD(P)-dependent dehydrogenase (short-subunit alcohol dehydrogenase family)
LTSAGAELVLPVRDPTAFDTSAGYQQLTVVANHGELMPIDLGSMSSVLHTGAPISAGHPRIDILIDNAGVMFTPRVRTANGFSSESITSDSSS